MRCERRGGLLKPGASIAGRRTITAAAPTARRSQPRAKQGKARVRSHGSRRLLAEAVSVCHRRRPPNVVRCALTRRRLRCHVRARTAVSTRTRVSPIDEDRSARVPYELPHPAAPHPGWIRHIDRSAIALCCALGQRRAAKLTEGRGGNRWRPMLPRKPSYSTGGAVDVQGGKTRSLWDGRISGQSRGPRGLCGRGAA